MTHTDLFQSPAIIISKVVQKKNSEKHKRSCYETMESHGEDTSCRDASFEQPLGKKNLWRMALQKRSWFWTLYFDSIGEWVFRLSLEITNLKFIS